ncbi:OmpA family protein [Asticcacaulis biprosthecium]|nr:OmpA family protein [Asticcacaulis biprosthecium]
MLHKIGTWIAVTSFLLTASVAVAWEDRYFIIYFWPNQHHLNEDALAVVGAAAEHYKLNSKWSGRCSPPIIKLDIAGHTDTVGDEAENLQLSQRRAFQVADELVRLGVPKAIMQIGAKGEAQLAVKTDDDVRELLNNRVSIDYYFEDRPRDCWEKRQNH